VNTATEEKRTLVVHHDDLGGSHSANAAFIELYDMGVVTTGSIMVPCPWFSEAASMARERPDLDLGVHLTLTSEFPNFRWRPLIGALGSSLVDSTGTFWPQTRSAARADRALVAAELRAQVEVALHAGIDVTHLDAHMGAAWQPELVDIYIELGREFMVPIVLTRDVGNMAPEGARYEEILRRSHALGNPDFRRFVTTPFGNLSPDLAAYHEIFDSVEPGLNWCGFHFAAPGDIEVISDDAPTRLAEYDIFRSGWALDYLTQNGFALAGMRQFRDALRAGPN